MSKIIAVEDRSPEPSYLDPSACRGFERTIPEPRFPRAGLRRRTDGRWQLMLWDANGLSFGNLVWVSWKTREAALEYACWAVQQWRRAE